ncbi:1-acyl-sn-glycerol-3-phosphate acyltransferase [Anaerotignum faecicola]|nr:1-acyl-sn-glycerol-3-phosphate acyltransferase [Anaerotignum faecicola]
MFRTIKFYIKALGAVIALVPLRFKAKLILRAKGRKAADEYIYKVVHWWAGGRVRDTGANVIVHNPENLPKDGNYLFVSNHQSNFDFAMLLDEIEIPVGFIAKIELKKLPIIKGWMDSIHCLFMDRSDMKQQLKIILEGIELLKSGHSLIIFPEGTRSRDGKIQEFKAGSFKLATKSKVPIIPLTIIGAADVLENNNYIIAPADVHLYVHKKIDVASLGKEELSKLHSTVQEIIEGPMK